MMDVPLAASDHGWGFHSRAVTDEAPSENMSSSADVPVDEDAAGDGGWSIPKLQARYGSDSGILWSKRKKKEKRNKKSKLKNSLFGAVWIYCQLWLCITSLQHPRTLKWDKACGRFQITAFDWWFSNFSSSKVTALRSCVAYCRPTRLLLGLSGHRFDCEIGHSKASAPQSSFLLCFVTTTVSILHIHSLIWVSALRSCLYISPNSAAALMATGKTVFKRCDQRRRRGEVFPSICLHVEFDPSFVKWLSWVLGYVWWIKQLRNLSW